MSAVLAKPVDYWTLNASGLTSVSSSWSLGVPQRGATVVVAPTAAGVVLTFDAAGYVLGALTLQGAAGVLQGGDLVVTGGATLQAATLLGPHALVVEATSQVSGLTLGGGAVLYNMGAVTQSGGAVVIGTSKTSRAVIVNLIGANWIDADGSAISQGATAGGWFLNHGTFTDAVGGVTPVGANFLSDGAVSVAARGTLELNGTRATLSGAFVGGGLVEYGAADVATLGALAVTATSQTNYGTVNLVGDMTLSGAQTIINQHIWNFDGDVSLLGGAGVQFTSVPNALVEKTAGTGVSVVSASAGVYGALEIDAGTLEFTGPSGFFNPVAGAGTLEIGGGTAQFGTYGPSPSGYQSISVAQLRLAAGTTTFSGPIHDTGAFEGDAGATLTATGDLTLSGAADFAGVVMNGSGEVILSSTTQISGGTVGGTMTLFDKGVVTQSGGAVTLGDAFAADAAALTLGNGGVWDIADASSLLSGSNLNSVVNVGSAGTAGLFEKTGAGVSVIAPIVLNNSSNVVTSAGIAYEGIEAAGGTLDLHNVVAGTGSDNIVGAGTLEFDNVVQAGQTVSFFGSGGSLVVDDGPGFKAGVVGFNASDSLLISGLSPILPAQLTGAIETASATVLNFAAGPATFSLTLTGDYQGDTFSAQSQTIGGPLKVTY